MKRGAAVMFLLLLVVVPSIHGQQDNEAARKRTRELLVQLLNKIGPEMKVTFIQSKNQPFNYLGMFKEGLSNADSFEIVASVTITNTIGFRIYPHYKGGYINIDKVRNPSSLMRQLLRLSDRAFLFWGADKSGDIFTGYTFTLEAGFPENAIKIVLRSVVNSDRFIGELRPAIDGSVAP